MRKTDKKREKQLVYRLNDVCEAALAKPLPGFCWLTRTVDYQRFPNSLQIYCVVEESLVLSGVWIGEEWLSYAIIRALAEEGWQIRKTQIHCLSESALNKRLLSEKSR
jgi:hypothetical protein